MPYPGAVHYLPVPTLHVVWAMHNCFCALLSTSVPLKIWALKPYMSILFTKINMESLCRCRLMGSQRVNMHCKFWVVGGWGETASLMSGCLQGQAECAQEHLGDSSDSRLSGIKVAQLNIGRMMGSQQIHSFCGREPILSATGPVTICTTVQYCNIFKSKKDNNFRLSFSLFPHKEKTKKYLEIE